MVSTLLAKVYWLQSCQHLEQNALENEIRWTIWFEYSGGTIYLLLIVIAVLAFAILITQKAASMQMNPLLNITFLFCAVTPLNQFQTCRDDCSDKSLQLCDLTSTMMSVKWTWLIFNHVTRWSKLFLIFFQTHCSCYIRQFNYCIIPSSFCATGLPSGGHLVGVIPHHSIIMTYLCHYFTLLL